MATPIPINHCVLRLDEIAAATGGEMFGAPDTIVRGVLTDTRGLGDGALFVALKGAGRDGHSYLAEAARRSAGAVVVARGRRPPGLAAVEVDDTLAALGDLARRHLSRMREAAALGCIAIGGAVGKTSTKELCAAVVRVLFGETLATPGNLNNLIGVPMTIFMLTGRHRAAVLECGTNTRGEIPRLARIVEPEVAAVLNVDVEHSEGLGGLEEIADEEAALFTTARRAMVACAEERLVMERIPRGAAVVTFGAGAAADVRVAARAPAAGGGGRSRVTLALNPRLVAAGVPARLDAALALLGAAAARNAAAAVAAAAALRARPLEAAELAAAARALESVAPVAGRLQPRSVGGLLVIDDTYNANPRSVRAALEAAHESAQVPGARLVVALGDMLELGAFAPAMHAEAAADVMRLAPAAFVAVGPEMSAAAAAPGIAGRAGVLTAADSTAAAELVCTLVRAGDVVLVKGSRGIQMERIIEALGEQFGNRV
ncbi:MAG TPA: UDP-N-acetylmuramoyl-tripeptide--D-alanyl-D-alanine ligase [Candidatus Binataceae bacterium]|jgi:UDP-N-acetylmuramoyl-tripeptide--D-alanyl-D-alanine ligase|nr:UDP-N-acetylmuramoyl-tripeptide--D-alanyl-D-alanine ligase [Candidatus Binataceae bacterium]